MNRLLTSYPTRITEELKVLKQNYETNYKGYLAFYQYMFRYIMTDPLFGLGEKHHHRGMLIYYPPGVGKTNSMATAALSMIDLRPIVFISPKSIHSVFIRSIEKILDIHKHSRFFNTRKVFDEVMARIKLLAIDAFNVGESLKSIGTLDDKLVIVDEAHNLFKSIISSQTEKSNAKVIYDTIMTAKNVRLLFSTGTPMSKDPFELVPCFNMLAGVNLLPIDYRAFYAAFVGTKPLQNGKVEEILINKEKLQNRLFGLLTYVEITQTDFKRKNGGVPEELGPYLVNIEMSDEQYSRYLLMRQKETKKLEKKFTPKSVPKLSIPPSEGNSSTYYVASRQAGNFAPPLSEGEVNINALPDDMFTKENGPKMVYAVNLIKEINGICIVYSQFVQLGLQVLARYLKLDGYEAFNPEASLKTPAKRYVIFSGEMSATDRAKCTAAINDPENKYGDILRVILISKVGAEGISIFNARSVIILEPYWYWSRIEQIKARGIRRGSHDALPIEERDIKIYILIATPNKKIYASLTHKEPLTVDERFIRNSVRKNILIQKFNEMLKEISIECSLNGGSNCRVCVPDDSPLIMHPNDPALDLALPDRCRVKESYEITTKTIKVKGIEYQYAKNDEAALGYSVYKYDEKIKGYVEVEQSSQEYIEVIKKIQQENG